MALIFKLVNFLIFALLIYVLGRKYVLSALKERRNSVKEGIESSEDLYSAVLAEHSKWEEAEKHFDVTAEEILHELSVEGASERDRIVFSAKEYSERLIKETARLIENQKTKIVEEVKNVAINEAIALARVELIKGSAQPGLGGEMLKKAKNKFSHAVNNS